MQASVFDIAARRRSQPLAGANVRDFGLRGAGTTDAAQVLSDPCCTLYCFDFTGGHGAVFVATPPQIDLSRAPFLYLAQYEHATRVVTMPLETLGALGCKLPLDAARLVFIHSVGRAGSTLASQVFAHTPGVASLSEPDALTWLVIARHFQPDNERLAELLDATVRVLCKTPDRRAWAIKPRSFGIELGDWLHELFPQARHLFLYRDAQSWLSSCLRAYVEDKPRSPEVRVQEELAARRALAPVAPLLAEYAEDRHLPVAGIYALMWLSVMGRALRLQGAGVQMLPIRYASWRAAGRDVARAMLDYCGVATDMDAVTHVLDADSQAGTPLSRAEVQRRERAPRPDQIEELERHLRAHPTIRSADFVFPGSL